LGVNQTWETCNYDVYSYFESTDFEVSYRDDLPILLQNYPVVIYNGNFDLICNYFGEAATLNSMPWPGQQGFLNAANVTWTVNGQAAGSARSYDNLTFVVVYNAGHMVPHDQGQNALDLLNHLLTGKPFGK